MNVQLLWHLHTHMCVKFWEVNFITVVDTYQNTKNENHEQRWPADACENQVPEVKTKFPTIASRSDPICGICKL